MKDQTLEATLSVLAGPDLPSVPGPELWRRLLAIPSFSRQRLLAQVSAFATDSVHLQDELSRVVTAKVLAALLPESFGAIRNAYDQRPISATTAEFHFSLSVALTDSAEVLEAPEIERLTAVVRDYLLLVDTDIGQAAWMAGDLLGDHWPLSISLRPLVEVADHGHFPAGRLGAIHGLARALNRASKQDQWEIVQALKGIAGRDNDGWVRRSAELAIGELRGV